MAYRGVVRIRKTGKFGARIKANRKHVWLGTFITAIEAAKAYDREAFRVLGRKATLNFPRDFGFSLTQRKTTNTLVPLGLVILLISILHTDDTVSLAEA